jgi:O-antigen/teichoic acid export membrane protein
VLDQGLISGSNFLVGVLLARWLLPEQFGAYALAFSLFLLVSMLHQALLLEPQKVFGPSVYSGNPHKYLGILLWFNAAIGLVVFIILGVSAWVALLLGTSVSLSRALAGVAFAAPCILLFWLARGAVYVNETPEMAAKGGFLYSLLVLVGLVLTFRRGMLSPFTGFGVMGLAALLTSLVLLIQLRPILTLGENHHEFKRVAEQHWRYGRWVLGSSLIGWVSGDIYYPLISLFAGVAAAGALKALMNLALPASQTYVALSQLFLPHGSRRLARDGWIGLYHFTIRITCLFGGGAILYWIIIITIRKPIFDLLYGGRYMAAAGLLPWIALGSIFGNALNGPVIALKAMQSSNSVFMASAASCAISLAVGIPATRFFGLGGVMSGLVLATFVPLVITVVLLHRRHVHIPLA